MKKGMSNEALAELIVLAITTARFPESKAVIDCVGFGKKMPELIQMGYVIKKDCDVCYGYFLTKLGWERCLEASSADSEVGKIISNNYKRYYREFAINSGTVECRGGTFEIANFGF